MATSELTAAKIGKNDEFYTQYHDIEVEVNGYLDFNPDVFRDKTVLLPCDDPEWSNFTRYFAQNFERLGLKRLVSTSFAPDSKKVRMLQGVLPFEEFAPQFDPAKAQTRGKIYVLDRDVTGDGRIDIDDLQWEYMEGDGDFRSKEVCRLRDEADIIVTNPPFSLFREFVRWIVEAGKQFLIIGNMNAITYKEVFPLLQGNRVWLGRGFSGGNAWFATPYDKEYASGVRNETTGLVKFRNCCWFTNLDHGRRHEPLPLMTMADNLRFSRHKELRGRDSYERYDNYDAIEVPYTDAIPSDFQGVMGVPISFLDKYCPEQFEIIGLTDKDTSSFSDILKPGGKKYDRGYLNGRRLYARILIRHKTTAQ